MRRRLYLSPQAFLDILDHGGCELGFSNGRVQFVTRPEAPGIVTMVRLDQDVVPGDIEAHLVNLGIPFERFLEWHAAVVENLRS